MRTLAACSRDHLASGAPPYLAVFAHDGNGHQASVMGGPEQQQFDLVFAALEKEGLIRGVAVDAGANIGIHSLRFAELYDYVFAFEPHPNTCQLLRHNLSNYAPNASVFELALAAETGVASLSTHKTAHSGSFSTVAGQNTAQSFPVDTMRLDDLEALKGQDVGLIKIDVEGAELQVLTGARETLLKNRPVVIMEDWESRNGTPGSAANFLMKLGYATFLEPVLTPETPEMAGPRILRTLVHAVSILRHGRSFALKTCDFKSPGGYQVLIALHDDAGPNYNLETRECGSLTNQYS